MYSILQACALIKRKCTVKMSLFHKGMNGGVAGGLCQVSAGRISEDYKK